MSDEDQMRDASLLAFAIASEALSAWETDAEDDTYVVSVIKLISDLSPAEMTVLISSLGSLVSAILHAAEAGDGVKPRERLQEIARHMAGFNTEE